MPPGHLRTGRRAQFQFCYGPGLGGGHRTCPRMSQSFLIRCPPVSDLWQALLKGSQTRHCPWEAVHLGETELATAEETDTQTEDLYRKGREKVKEHY